MHVPVDEVARVKAVEQLVEASEAPVRRIVRVSQIAERRMGQHDVHAARQKDTRPEAHQPLCHLPFGVLVRAAAVADAAAEAENAQPVDFDQPVLNAVAALGRMRIIAAVMIAAHIQQRRAPHCHKEGKIVRVQIAAGQNQVDPVQTARLIIVPKVLAFHVGQKKQLHARALPRFYLSLSF